VENFCFLNKNLLMKNKNEDWIAVLTQRFQRPLPAKKSHIKIAHALRSLDELPDENARKASVLILLFPKKTQKGVEWHFLLMERTTHVGDKHSGQMSFPGGGYQASDGELPEGLWQCALREAQEEVGIDPQKIHIIGQMSELYIPVSKYQVFPYLAWTNDLFSLKPQLSEVKTIYEVPLSLLQNPANLKVTDLRVSEQLTLLAVPYYDLYGKAVWGATAMILTELLDLLENTSVDK
jgi:8-oxo-dGTP pyrophosphatase MutT (NUDIX family)